MADAVVPQPAADDLLRVAIAAHLARYKGLSRVHTGSDLRVFLRWCAEHELKPLRVRRSDVELFVRWLEEIGRFKPATVARAGRTTTQPLDHADERAIARRSDAVPSLLQRDRLDGGLVRVRLTAPPELPWSASGCRLVVGIDELGRHPAGGFVPQLVV